MHDAAGQNTALLSCNLTVMMSCSPFSFWLWISPVKAGHPIPTSHCWWQLHLLPSTAVFCTLLRIDLTHQSSNGGVGKRGREGEGERVEREREMYVGVGLVLLGQGV